MSVETGRYQDDFDQEEEEELEPWVKIQNNTFTNWVNDKLRPQNVIVPNLRHDLRDGTKLCLLMLALLRRKATSAERIIQPKKKGQELNHYEASGNLQIAINLMQQDGVRLVNIGAEDIRGGNIKLILGMIWTLIRKYQIGSSLKTPPKKLMLSWVNAVLHPHLTVTNFSTDWNSGQALHGLIEWCRPGTFPQWMNLNLSDYEGNCRDGMDKAESLFNIPIVISAKDMASDHLDELSGMTYVSYFMHEGQDGIREAGAGERSCGYEATLHWANRYLGSELRTTNFDVDWNDGYRACALITALRGDVPGFPNIPRDNHVKTCEMAMIAAGAFGIPQVISPSDMADMTVDHLGVMAYVAWHRKAEAMLSAEHFPPPPPEPESVLPVEPSPPPSPEPESVLPVEPSPPPSPEPESILSSEPSPPPSPEPERVSPPPPPIPEPVPVFVPPVPVMTEAPPVAVSIPENWKVDATMTAITNTSAVGPEPITATITSPRGDRAQEQCECIKTDEYKYDIPFTPREKGLYRANIYYAGIEVRGSPFMINVYDISYAKLIRDKDRNAFVGEKFPFQVDISGVGYNDLDIYIFFEGRNQPFKMEQNQLGVYEIIFSPQQPGKYMVSAYCGGEEIPGSPFELDVKQAVVLTRGKGLESGFTAREARFEVDTSQFPGKSMETKIYSPSGRMLRAEVTREATNPDVHVVKYRPDEIGTHQVEIFYSDGPIPGSPYYVNIREPQVYVTHLEGRPIRNRPSHFQIDATEMLDGTVEIDSALPVLKYEKIGDKMYRVTMLPKQCGKFDFLISINGRSVGGSPFQVDVTEENAPYEHVN